MAYRISSEVIRNIRLRLGFKQIYDTLNEVSSWTAGSILIRKSMSLTLWGVTTYCQGIWQFETWINYIVC